ncbi:MAG: single-stranded DNA-binding protein [Gemmatimonadota bacterium]|nr:MAG: single-stranded DNA-binding protein [Gemmatimonadota bacterium]
MSRSVNKAIIVGNLGNDPEIRTTSQGTRVATLSVATNRRWQSRTGEMQEDTQWHRIVAWNKLAEIVEQYLKKGDRVYVEGRLQYRQWEDQNGQKRYTTEIVANDMVMLGGRGEGAFETQRASTYGGEDYDDFPAESLEEGDDLPF